MRSTQITILLFLIPAALLSQSLKEAQKLFSDQDYRGAARAFQQLAEAPSADSALYDYLLKSLMYSSQGAEAVEWCTKVMNRTAPTAHWLQMRGRAHYINCQVVLAIRDANEARAQMGNDSLYYDLAYYYSHLDSHQQALEAAGKIDATSKYFFAALNIKGIAKTELGDKKGAKKDFKAALSVCPSNADKALLYCNLGRVDFRQQNNNTAIDYYSKAIKADSHYVRAYISRGYIKQQTGFANDAQADFQKAIALANTNCTTCGDYCEWLTYFYLGVAYGHLQDFEQSAIAFDKAIALRPCEGEIFYYRGWTKGLALGFVASCSDWKKAAELGNKDALQSLELYCK